MKLDPDFLADRRDIASMDIKVRFQHQKSKKYVKEAELIGKYLRFQGHKVYRMACFWLFFLKMGGLVGKEQGYPSSSAFLMLLFNYLQNQLYLPNLQEVIRQDVHTLLGNSAEVH